MNTSKKSPTEVRTEADRHQASVERVKRKVDAVSAGIAIAAAALAFMMTLGQFGQRAPGIEIQFLRDIDKLKAKNEALEQSLSELRSQVDAMANPDTKTETGQQLASLSKRFDDTAERIAAIEAAILDSPTKALSVPMLRRDLENLQDDYQSERAVASREIDRVYDQNKWFLGLVVTMTLAICGLAVSNFLHTRKTNADDAS